LLFGGRGSSSGVSLFFPLTGFILGSSGSGSTSIILSFFKGSDLILISFF